MRRPPRLSRHWKVGLHGSMSLLTLVAGKEYKGSTLKVTQDRGVQSRVAIAFLPKSYTAAEVTALLQDVPEPSDIHLSQPGPRRASW